MITFAETTIKGRVTDADSKNPLPSVNILLTGTKMGASTDADGNFTISNVPDGAYQIKASIIGYVSQDRAVSAQGGTVTVNFLMKSSSVQVNEVIVEVNRAKERETPVAFSNVGSKSINKTIHSQDAPLLVKGLPGVFSYSTDGVGNGESKMFVRGFDQGRVQVMINGIPTNDPESNAVYWSNWGAVSSAAASIQVQRGAGSSLYGAGSFGGSFNVVTQEVGPRPGLELHTSIGDPQLGVYGGSITSGLMLNNTVAGALNYEYKTGSGTRKGGYYEGANYYAAIATYPGEHHTVKFLMHGGPQIHSYSYNAPIAYFKNYGYDANPAYFIPKAVLTHMLGSKTLQDSLNLASGKRLMTDSKYMSLSNNFYHKPQFEIHYNGDLDPNNTVRGTFFYSVGRGGGSSLNGTGNLTGANIFDASKRLIGIYAADTTYPTNAKGMSAANNLLSDGTIGPDAQAYIAGKFLSGAVQKISYSLHRQYGFVGSWDTKVMDNLKVVLGGEYRSWYADHPGHFTNLFGKKFVTPQSYGYRVNGKVAWDNAKNQAKAFSRRSYQGDMDFGGADRIDVNYWNPFMGYSLVDDGGTYNTQYRNYVGQTDQGTFFAQANYQISKDLTILGSLQYVTYKYHLTENMPSESAVGDSSAAPASGREGLNAADGLFYMASYANAGATTPNAWYKFKLVDQTRTRGFFQPKIGFNYNLSNELNVFANVAHAERLVDLGVWYNSGNPNPNANDEKSNQYEAGVGYKNEDVNVRLNGYIMTWQNKTASITDVSKAGEPGYDRNGNRYELIGESKNQGLELEASVKLDNLLPIKGFTLAGSFAAMDNKWTKVLDEVKKDAFGKRRAFDAGALNAEGKVDTLFFDELENTVNASTPFTTLAYGLTYENDVWFASITGNTFMNYYALDGGTYIPVDGTLDTSGPIAKLTNLTISNKLPNATTFDFQAGFNMTFEPVRVRVTGQVINLLDKEYIVNANRSGVLPGVSRTFRLNVAVGI
ncbi:MAG TPA: TonB-dependent receptor [Bacteroidota bacterium]|nr:TonB-dependent receptor [Bacteroidota bacterium]